MPSINRSNNGLVTVSYATREAQQVVTSAEISMILAPSVSKVTAIKFIREQYKLGLYEAKQVVDTIHQIRDISDYRLVV